MVKIRYAELPAGLHVATEDRNGCTIVYLLPGLTPSQRRAALTFARRSARIGHGPRLPAIDMAFAVGADRVRTTGRTVVAVLRKHPMLLLPLVAVVSAVIVVTMLSCVTVSLGSVNDPATDAPPAHHTGEQPGNHMSSPSLDSSANPAPASTSTSFVPAVVPTAPAASSGASVAGESAGN